MSNRYDLTSGSIADKLIFIAIPIIGTQLMQMAYNLTDMFWLGKLSEDAVAASSAAGMYLWLSVSLMLFGQMGASIGVSQCIGRGDRDEAARFAENALMLSIVLGLAYAVVLTLFKTQLIAFYRIQDARVADMAQIYLFTVAPFVPLSFVSSVITGCYTASGNSRTPFFINGAGLFINVLLDPALIFYAGWGIKGAAAATVIAQAAAAAIAVCMFKFSRNRPFRRIKILTRPDPVKIKQICAWSAPVAAENLLFSFLSMMFTRIIAFWGTGALAVFRVGTEIESLNWMVGEGLASAVTAYTGQNFGAGKWRRIHKGFFISLALMASWGFAVTILLLLFSGQLVGMFLSAYDTRLMGAEYIRILAVSQVAMSLEFVAAGAFRGMGRTLPPSVVSISVNVVRLIIAYVLSGTALGLKGVWWAVSLGSACRGGLALVWYLLYSRKLPKDAVLTV